MKDQGVVAFRLLGFHNFSTSIFLLCIKGLRNAKWGKREEGPLLVKFLTILMCPLPIIQHLFNMHVCLPQVSTKHVLKSKFGLPILLEKQGHLAPLPPSFSSFQHWATLAWWPTPQELLHWLQEPQLQSVNWAVIFHHMHPKALDGLVLLAGQSH